MNNKLSVAEIKELNDIIGSSKNYDIIQYSKLGIGILLVFTIDKIFNISFTTIIFPLILGIFMVTMNNCNLILQRNALVNRILKLDSINNEIKNSAQQGDAPETGSNE